VFFCLYLIFNLLILINSVIIFPCLFSWSAYASAQKSEVIKYFNESWQEVSADSAFYITYFKPEGDIYQVISYRKKSNTLYRTSYFKTTDFSQVAKGANISYYENGQIQDSSYMLDGGIVATVMSYYPDGKIRAKYSFDPATNKRGTVGYDENGKQIRG